MFSVFENENEIQKLIRRDGLEYAAKRFSEIILDKCDNHEIALQFILEEIEAASKGNDEAIKFAKNSGFSPNDYFGAMANSRPEVDGPDGPQQFLLYLTTNLRSDIDLMVKFRTTIVDNIMKKLSVGKYA